MTQAAFTEWARILAFFFLKKRSLIKAEMQTLSPPPHKETSHGVALSPQKKLPYFCKTSLETYVSLQQHQRPEGGPP